MKSAKEKYTAKLLDVLSKFGLAPVLDLNDMERDILDVVSQIEDAGFYDLCECFDMKPSKMEKWLIELEDKGLVLYMDAAGKVLLTDLAKKYVENYRKDTRKERKFRKFIECLNDEELDNFMKLADAFVIDESLLTPAEEAEEETGNNFVVVDEEAAAEASEEEAETAEAEAENTEEATEAEQPVDEEPAKEVKKSGRKSAKKAEEVTEDAEAETVEALDLSQNPDAVAASVE